MPHAGNSADFQVIAFILCIDQYDFFGCAGHIDKNIFIMRNTGDTADITGGTLDIDIGGHILNSMGSLSHEPDDTADIGAVVFRVCLDITAIVGINCKISQIRISVSAEHTPDISITVHFDYSGKLDIGIS